MSEKTYDGLCVGGPYDGQRLNVPQPVWEVATIPPIPVHMPKAHRCLKYREECLLLYAVLC